MCNGTGSACNRFEVWENLILCVFTGEVVLKWSCWTHYWTDKHAIGGGLTWTHPPDPSGFLPAGWVPVVLSYGALQWPTNAPWGILFGVSSPRSEIDRSVWCWPAVRVCQGSVYWRSLSQRPQWSRQALESGTHGPWSIWASGTSSAFAHFSSTSTSCRCWKGNPACWVRTTTYIDWIILIYNYYSYID